MTLHKAKAESKTDAQPETAEKIADPSQSKNAEAQLKKDNRIIKSQAGLHASKNARLHAAPNSAVFTNSPTEEKAETETDVQAEYYFGTDSATAAFVNYLNQYGEGVKPGTYFSQWSWEVSMEDFSPSTPGAYWVAYYPGDIPEDLTISNPDWGNFPGTTEKAQIWQYYGGENDYNVAWKLP